MGYIISGVNTLFTRFAMVDFEKNTYQYLASYVKESSRQELIDFMDRDSIIRAMSIQNDLRLESPVIKDGNTVWEHVNVICLERKDDMVSKVLFIRQNVTELKQKELRIQKERALANRKERQYQIALLSNALCSFEINLTQDLIERDIIRTIDGQSMSLLEQVKLTAPCKASEYFEKRKQFILAESMEDYSDAVNTENLLRCFEQGDREVTTEYWEERSEQDQMCVRQSFTMTMDDSTGDIMVMVVSKDITEQVGKQREQTQALFLYLCLKNFLCKHPVLLYQTKIRLTSGEILT